MIWHSSAEFFAMGGYGLYVWGSYGVAAIFMLVEPLVTARRHRRAHQAAASAEGENQ
jgi:heme exporter protein D